MTKGERAAAGMTAREKEQLAGRLSHMGYCDLQTQEETARDCLDECEPYMRRYWHDYIALVQRAMDGYCGLMGEW